MSADPGPSSAPKRAPSSLEHCALARAVRAIGDAWTLLILREALCGVERFEAIRDDLGIPRSVLADRLAQLVANGILEQRPYRVPGQRTRQASGLSDKGRALRPALIALRDWGNVHAGGPPSRLALRDATGQRVTTRVVRDDGTAVEDYGSITLDVEDAHGPAAP